MQKKKKKKGVPKCFTENGEFLTENGEFITKNG